MSKLKSVLSDPKTLVVFDIDGTLSSYNYGDYHCHHEKDTLETKDEFDQIDVYMTARRIPVIVEYIKEHIRYGGRVFALSKEPHGREESKRRFCKIAYGINPSDVYCVKENVGKIDKLREWSEAYKVLEPEGHIVFIDDNEQVLRMVEDNTDVYTAHVTIFFEEQ